MYGKGRHGRPGTPLDLVSKAIRLKCKKKIRKNTKKMKILLEFSFLPCNCH